jgi:ATP-binding cassette, subfamily B, bacterial
MVAKHYGKSYSLQKLRDLSFISREGVSSSGISEAAEKIDFRTMGDRINLDQLSKSWLPFTIYWKQNHFILIYKTNLYVKYKNITIIPKFEEKMIWN